MDVRLATAFATVAAVLACGPTSEVDDDITPAPADAATSAPPDSRWIADAAPLPDIGSCQPPDLMITLDRTLSMHKLAAGGVPDNTPAGHAMTRWGVAIASIEALTASMEQTVRFGLTLFPKDPGQGCVTIGALLDGEKASNPQCQRGRVHVEPALATASAIDQALDVQATTLCRSTPIGPALERVANRLGNLRDPIRAQYVLLVTDGGDTCDVDESIARAQGLAAEGVRTFVVGFTTGNNANLNHLACAGQTAPGFPAPCVLDQATGGYLAADPAGPALYQVVDENNQLPDILENIAGDVCCGCGVD